MFCPNCGTDVGKSKYCPNCGSPVNTTENTVKAEAPAAGYQQYRQVPDGERLGWKKVNKIAYGLIAIFLGNLGIHRFYAGKILSGVIYLLFFWTFIPSILGLVEGIVALTRNSDEYGNIYVNPHKYFV